MSKITAYLCNYCNSIHDADSISGVENREALIDPVENSFKLVHPDKTDIHFCMECYDRIVLTPVINATNRRKDEAEYAQKLKECTYSFKKGVVILWAKRKRDRKK